MAKKEDEDKCMSQKDRALFIVIPFFNEAENLENLAFELSQFIKETALREYQIILVNDGSTDRSKEEAAIAFSDLRYKLLTHKQNQGPGAAFQTAFEEILKTISKDDYVLTIEADNTSNLKIVSQMLKRSKEGYDVVLASPYIYGGTIINTPFIRRFLSFFANLFLRELLGLRGILTISSFFRLYKGAIFLHIARAHNNVFMQRKGFEGKVELLMKLVLCKASISEVPLVLDTSRRKGRSKMKLLKTTISLLSLYFEKNKWKQQAIVYKT